MYVARLITSGAKPQLKHPGAGWKEGEREHVRWRKEGGEKEKSPSEPEVSRRRHRAGTEPGGGSL